MYNCTTSVFRVLSFFSCRQEHFLKKADLFHVCMVLAADTHSRGGGWSQSLANAAFPWTLTARPAEIIWTLTKLWSTIYPSCASCAVCVVYLCKSYCLPSKVSILCSARCIHSLSQLLFQLAHLCSLSAGWQVMNRCRSCHWTLYRRRLQAGPTTSCVTVSDWRRSSAGCAEETRAWQKPWGRLSSWAPQNVTINSTSRGGTAP